MGILSHGALASTAVLVAMPLSVPGVASAADPGSAEVVCTVDDPRAVELSGLVATDDGYVTIVDSRWDPQQTLIVYLDRSCQVVRTLGYPSTPRDPEDLAVAPDGALWVADIGDNDASRPTVALWRIPPNGGAPVIHRFTYPDGAHDAEALLFATDGTPLIVTKEIAATAHLYQATRAPEPGTTAGVPLRLVGTVDAVLVTGAATAPDRSRVVVRTYTDAYEWDVPDGDVIRAITSDQPRIIPLPGEPQGEAIAYTVDGQELLTLSDQDGPAELRRYHPTPGPSSTNDAEATPNRATPTRWVALGALAVLVIGALALLLTRRRR